MERRADVEVVDAIENTPLLVAAGSGLTDVCQVLLTARANIGAENVNAVGALQKALHCSTSCASFLKSQGAPKTTGKSGRTRTGTSQNRMLQRAITYSHKGPRNGQW